MNKKALILGLFAVIILAIGLGFWRGESGKKAEMAKKAMIQQQQAEEVKKQEDEAQSSQEDEKVEFVDNDWKLYQNTKYEFELKYPKDWELEVLNTDFNKNGDDLFFFKEDDRNHFAVFPKGGFGHGIQEPEKITDELFAGRKAKKLWYKYSFPLYTYITNDLPENWGSENVIDIKISDDNKGTIEKMKSIYDSFRFIDK